MAISIPAQFPVWLVDPSGRSVIIGDAPSYTGALALGCTPFTAMTPSAKRSDGVSATTVLELPFNQGQTLPADQEVSVDG